MTMLDVLANAFDVPLILGPVGKRKAIAAHLAAITALDDDPAFDAVFMEASEAVVDYVLALGNANDLDGILGGYRDNSDRVAAAAPDGPMSEPPGTRYALTLTLLMSLTEYVRANPRDTG